MLKLMFRCRNVHGLFDISFLLLFSTVFSMFFFDFFSINFKIGLKKWKKKRPKAAFFKPWATLEGNWLLPNLHGIDLSQQYTWVLISGRNFLTSCSATNNAQWICRPSPLAAQRQLTATQRLFPLLVLKDRLMAGLWPIWWQKRGPGIELRPTRRLTTHNHLGVFGTCC